MIEKYQKEPNENMLNNKGILDICKANQIIDAMQMHNYNCDYDKTIELYDKYRDVFSNNAFSDSFLNVDGENT